MEPPPPRATAPHGAAAPGATAPHGAAAPGAATPHGAAAPGAATPRSFIEKIIYLPPPPSGFESVNFENSR